MGRVGTGVLARAGTRRKIPAEPNGGSGPNGSVAQGVDGEYYFGRMLVRLFFACGEIVHPRYQAKFAVLALT